MTVVDGLELEPLKKFCTCDQTGETINVKETQHVESKRRHQSKCFKKIFFWKRANQQASNIDANVQDDGTGIGTEVRQESHHSLHHKEDCFHLLMLPDEVMVHMAFYLPKDETYINLALTCKKMCSLLMDKVLWNRSHLAQHKSIIPITNTRPRRGCLRSLDLTNCVQASDRYIFFIVRLHPKIEEIILAGCKKITDKSMRCLIRFLKKLKKVDISDTCHISSRIVSEFFAYFNESLEYFDMSHSVGTLQDRYQLRGIKWKMHNLSVLKLNWDRFLDWSSVGGFWIIMELLESCPKLQILEIGGYDMLASEISESVKNLTHLRKIHFPKCLINSQEVKKFFSTIAHQVTNLDLSGCSASVTEEEVHVLAKTQRNLKVLDLSHCYHLDDGMVRMIVENLTELRDLRLQSCHKVGDIGLDTIIKHSKITYLDVSDTCVTLTHLQAVLRTLPEPNALLVIANGCARDKPLRHDFWQIVPEITSLKNKDVMASLIKDFQSQPQFPAWSKVY